MYNSYQINHIKFKKIYHENLHIILGITSTARGTATLFQCGDISLQFIIRLKSFRVSAFLSELANLNHNKGPKYLMECLPYFTVLYLGRIKSEFRRLYGFKSFLLTMFSK